MSTGYIKKVGDMFKSVMSKDCRVRYEYEEIDMIVQTISNRNCIWTFRELTSSEYYEGVKLHD